MEVDPPSTGGASSSSGFAMVAAATPLRAIQPGTDPDLIGEIRDLYGYIGGPGNGRLPKPTPSTRPEFAYVYRKFKSTVAVREETFEALSAVSDRRTEVLDDLAHQVQNKYIVLMEC